MICATLGSAFSVTSATDRPEDSGLSKAASTPERGTGVLGTVGAVLLGVGVGMAVDVGVGMGAGVGEGVASGLQAVTASSASTAAVIIRRLIFNSCLLPKIVVEGESGSIIHYHRSGIRGLSLLSMRSLSSILLRHLRWLLHLDS